MSFSVTILGSNSAVPTPERFPTAQVLNVHERFFLIDCGEGTQIRLKKFRINISRITRIFISHLHGDHVFGLFGLMSTYTLNGRKADLHIHAHRDFEVTLEHYKKYFGTGLCYNIVFHPFTTQKQEEIYNDRHLSVEIVPLRHSVPVAGFIFREKAKPLNMKKEAIAQYNLGIKDIRKIKDGADYISATGELIPNVKLTLPPIKPRSYAFCTDTSAFSRLSKVLKDVDLLYFEATFSQQDKRLAKLTGHSTAAQAATIARNAHAGRLIMGHFSNRYKSPAVLENEAREIFPESHAVEDGEKFEVMQVRVE